MKPEDVTIAAIVPHAGITEIWHGRCFEIASIVTELFPELNGVAVYGHYLGPISPDGHWGGRRGMPFNQHGWVLLPDGRVLDPTRWSFTNEDAFIYLDHNDEDYDEGGNQWRETFARPCPMETKDKRRFKLKLSHPERHHLEGVFPPGVDLDAVTVEQIFWLANLSYDVFGPYVGKVYKALEDAGMIAAIPWDNRKRARREYPEAFNHNSTALTQGDSHA